MDSEADELFRKYERGLEGIKIKEDLNSGCDQELLDATLAIEGQLQDERDMEIEEQLQDGDMDEEGVTDELLGLLSDNNFKSEPREGLRNTKSGLKKVLSLGLKLLKIV